MTTGSTNTTFDHSTDANFRTWANELMTMLITTLGVTQTTDTGQLAFPLTVTTRPGTNTAAGYYILKFNDVLQGTLPIFIKVEVGTGASTTAPIIWLTVGTGSNGSGTLTGLSTRVSCGIGGAPISSVANYTSRACYNATQGVLWIDWKQSGNVVGESSFMFHIFRSVDNTGAPTANAIGFQGCGAAANTISASSNNPIQWYNAATSAWLGPVLSTPSGWAPAGWGWVPYSGTGTTVGTLVGTAGQVFPCFQYAPTASVPAHGITNAQAICDNSEISVGSTVSLTILGSTALTYIAGLVGSSGLTTLAYSISVFNLLRIWQ